MRLVCWPWESSSLFWRAEVWSGDETVPLSVGGAGAGLLCAVGLCRAYSRGLDWSVTCVWDHVMVGEKRMTRAKTAFMISRTASLRIRCKGGLPPEPIHTQHSWKISARPYRTRPFLACYGDHSSDNNGESQCDEGQHGHVILLWFACVTSCPTRWPERQRAKPDSPTLRRQFPFADSGSRLL